MFFEALGFFAGSCAAFAAFVAVVDLIGEWHADLREKIEGDIAPLREAYLAHLWVKRELAKRSAEQGEGE
jgi:hypothetical protein